MLLLWGCEKLSMQKINCKNCMGDNHNQCSNPDTCLCADNKHGESLANGVRVDNRMSSPKNEPMNFEKSRHNAITLQTMRDEGIGNNSPQYALIEFTKLLIVSDHMVSKFDLLKEMKDFCKKYRIDDSEIDPTLKFVFDDQDVFQNVKTISNNLGRVKKQVLFDKTQVIETAEWLKGRYHLKRIEVTGDLLFFNGEFYDTNAEAWIRRTARTVIARAKTSEINEIVKYIEDTCRVVTWKDIEKSIHLKCMLNGIYDIKTGVFSTKFNPEYIILNQIPHNYNEQSSWDEILSQVKTLIPDDKHRQSYFDFISSCFHPYTGVDYQFGMVGGTGTGKSQLGILATLVVGEKNTKDATIHLLAKDQTTQKNVAFKMLNIDYDLNDESIDEIGTIKKWVTQDTFTARGIYEQSSDFRPMSRLMFMANDLYEIPNEDDAEAIYDRTYLIRVDKKFRHQENEIKNVMKKTATTDELEGFVTYLLNNATWIYENESYHHTIAVDEVESIWNSYGNFIRTFTEKWIVYGAFRTEASEPFNKWMAYCIKIGHKPKTKREFSAIFNEIVGSTPSPTRNEKGESERMYAGFRFKTDDELAKEETTPFSNMSDLSTDQIIDETEIDYALGKLRKLRPFDFELFFQNFQKIITPENHVANVAKDEVTRLLNERAKGRGENCKTCDKPLEWSKLQERYLCFGCQDKELREQLKRDSDDLG